MEKGLVTKLQFNVARKNANTHFQPYSVLMYEFFVLTEEKEEKIEFIAKCITRHNQDIIDIISFKCSDTDIEKIMSNTVIKNEIKSYL